MAFIRPYTYPVKHSLLMVRRGRKCFDIQHLRQEDQAQFRLDGRGAGAAGVANKHMVLTLCAV